MFLFWNNEKTPTANELKQTFTVAKASDKNGKKNHQKSDLKALANEDTLLPTHCCRHKCFPVCPRAQHLLRTQILCPGHKKCF